MTREERKEAITLIKSAQLMLINPTTNEPVSDLYMALNMAIKALSQEPTDAVSRILNRMWNCRGKHTTSIDKVAMEQIIRDELTSVTPKSIECDDAISRDAVLKKIDDEVEQLPSVTQKSTGCDDAISREDTLKAIIKNLGISSKEYLLEAEKAVYKTVENMPPVTPQQSYEDIAKAFQIGLAFGFGEKHDEMNKVI